MTPFKNFARFFISLFLILQFNFFSFSNSPINLISGGGNKGPEISPIAKKTYKSADGKYKIDLGALKKGNSIWIQGNIGKGPRKPTFEQIFLQDKEGRRIYPVKVFIMEKWGHVKLNVSWTKRTYLDGVLVSEESGGWSEAWSFLMDRKIITLRNPLTGESFSQMEMPPPIWQRLGFVHPYKGARSVHCVFVFPESAGNINDWEIIAVYTIPGNFGGYDTGQIICSPFTKQPEFSKNSRKLKLTQMDAPSYINTSEPKTGFPDPYDLAGPLSQMDDLLKEKITPETDCEEYYKMAMQLKKRQDLLKQKMGDAKLKKENALKEEVKAEADIKRLTKERKGADKSVKEAKSKLDSAKRNFRKYQKGIVKSINRSVKKGAALGGDTPEGFDASIGTSSGVFPLMDGEELHLKDNAAIEAFFKKIEVPETAKQINGFKNKIKNLEKALDQAITKRDKIDDGIKDAEGRRVQAKKDQFTAIVALTSLEQANDILNKKITKLNRKYKHCKKMIDQLKAEQAVAEDFEEKAEQGAKDAEKYTRDGDAGDAANATYSQAKNSLVSGKSKIKKNNFKSATKDFQNAINLFDRIAREKSIHGCLENFNQQINHAQAELDKQKKENPEADFTEAQNQINEAIEKYNEGQDALFHHDLEKAQKACSEGASLTRSAKGSAGQAIRNVAKEKLESLTRRGDSARKFRSAEALDNDDEIKEALKDVAESLKESIGLLDEWISKTEKGRKWFNKLREYAFKKSGSKIRIDQNMKVDQALELILKHAETAKKTSKEAQKYADGLNEIIAEGLVQVISDKVREKLIDLGSKLVARGATSFAGPLAALWSESWDFGAALGAHISNQLTQIAQSVYENAQKQGICEEGVQTGDKVPVVLDVYVEIVKKDGTPVRDAKANLKFKTSTAEYYEDVEVNKGRAVVTEMKYMNYIPGSPSSENLTQGEKTLKVIDKVITTQRICEATQIREVINIRYIVE